MELFGELEGYGAPIRRGDFAVMRNGRMIELLRDVTEARAFAALDRHRNAYDNSTTLVRLNPPKRSKAKQRQTEMF